MSFLWKLFASKPKHVNITFCGLDRAGKTAITQYLIKGKPVQTLPTMGINREFIEFPKLHLDIYDLGGQRDFQMIWPSINERSHGLVYVVDSTDKERLAQSKEVFWKIVNNQLNDYLPIVVLLNKMDLEDRIERTQFILFFDLCSLEKHPWACYETSVVSGHGLYDAFKWFTEKLKN
jgi:small GTP-binding protein